MNPQRRLLLATATQLSAAAALLQAGTALAALLAGEIDAAVHSMKDVETIRPDAIRIAAMLPRADVRDRLTNLRIPNPAVIAEPPHYALPVVAANAGGLPFVVDDGETGFLVDPAAPDDAWAEPLARLLTDADTNARMARHARAEAERWTWRASSEAVVGYYEEGIAGT